MTDKPSYVVNVVEEKDVTVDWFFGRGHWGKKLVQGALLLIGWFFAVLPVVVTASALRHRDTPGKGWWDYAEGFALWDTTIQFLGLFLGLFIVGYLALYLVNRASLTKRNARATYDEARLAQRLEIAEALYSEKFGPRALRVQQSRVSIQPYSDIETFELRGEYRTFGVD